MCKCVQRERLKQQVILIDGASEFVFLTCDEVIVIKGPQTYIRAKTNKFEHLQLHGNWTVSHVLVTLQKSQYT